MPTTYAHWRFGDKCISSLPEELQTIILNNREIFDYGVHGPDIYFYYKCMKHNDINKYGSEMHLIPFKKTLKEVKDNYKNVEDKNAAIAYMLGFVCHYTLDSYCHGYIDRKAEVSPVSHGKIESQFDRYLLIKDGYNPIKKSVTFSLKPNKKMAKTINTLFNKWNEDVVYKSLKDQKKYLNLLKDNTDFKRNLLIKAFNKFGTTSFIDLLITKENDPRCADSMLRLDKYFDKALEHYPILALSLYNYLENGRKLDDYFSNHFCPKKDYKSIPILSLDMERNYEVGLQD